MENERQLKIIHEDYKTTMRRINEAMSQGRAFCTLKPGMPVKQFKKVTDAAQKAFEGKLNRVQYVTVLDRKHGENIFALLMDEPITQNLLVLDDMRLYSMILAYGNLKNCVT
jgi:hypothetical protein